MLATHVLAAHGIPSVKSLLANNSENSAWIVYVTTGDRKDSGTDATVSIRLGDENEQWTKEIKLNQFGTNNYERGQKDEFPLKESDISSKFGNLEKVEVWRDSKGFNDSWFLDIISVHNIFTGVKFHFPAHRWIKADKRYFFTQFDSSLPQFDVYQQQRKDELAEKKAEYEYVVRNPGEISAGLPAQVKTLPHDETFSDSYKFEFIGMAKVKYVADKHLINLATGGTCDTWTSLEDLNNMYKFSMPLPAAERHWDTDAWFGQQRLQGANPVLIRLCTSPPTNLPVDKVKTEAILGTTLALAIADKRVFIVDLKIVEKLPITADRQICAPVALFYLTEDRATMLPLCIQLQQVPSDQNPIFYPTDEANVWLLAKMWYNNADACFHQSCTHLGLTHLQMEGIAVCVHRNLSPSHPMFKLVAPHFLYLLAINTLGLSKLISKDGWIDRTLTIGCAGTFELIHRRAQEWRLDVSATPPADCKDRGVDDPAVIPNYPYRDDAIAIYNAIRTYVSSIVNFYYDTPTKIQDDEELQNFAHELVLPIKKGGVGINGVPIADGKFKTTEEITDTIAAIISTCSMTHAAVNFNQYDEYGFPPNYPTRMSGVCPTKKDGFTEADVIKQLPTKATTLDIMVITRILSSRGTKSLGDFEVQYLYDPVSVRAAKKLRRQLEEISETIHDRNVAATTTFQYQWLDPDFIPNAISI